VESPDILKVLRGVESGALKIFGEDEKIVQNLVHHLAVERGMPLPYGIGLEII